MKKILIGVVAIAVIVGGFVYLSTPKEGVMDGPGTKAANLHIVRRKLVDGPSLFRVRKGDTVMLHIMNDEEEEFHLHGYDKSVGLSPNKEAMLMLKVDTAGRFPAELEGSKTEVFLLEVQP